MTRGATGAGLAAMAALMLAAACARSGPPAPVDDRGASYYGRNGIARVQPPPAQRPRPPAQIARRSTPPAQIARRTAPSAPPPVRSRPLPRKTIAVASGAVRTSRVATVRIGRGDTLYGIARANRVPLRALIEANDLAPPYRLRAGGRLRVPAVRVYEVSRGDTVYAIGRRFDIAPGAIIRENDLKPPRFALVAGQTLVLPWRAGGAPVPTRASVAKTQPPAAAPSAPRPKRVVARPPAPAPKPAAQTVRLPSRPVVRAPGAPRRKPPKRASSVFLWPVNGPVLSRYGPKGGGLYNDGINIAAREGSPVRAAENGVVAYAGNELGGYGNLLLIRHSDGWISAYAHNHRLLVTRGQVVRRGQTIALAGRSGAVAKPQVHFELRRGPRAVNPERYLSRRS